MNKEMPVYLFFGEEMFLLREAVQNLAERAGLSDHEKDMNFVVLDGKEIDEHDIVNQCETYPFLSDKRLVVVKNYKMLLSGGMKTAAKDDEKNEKKNTPLFTYLHQPSSWTVLLFIVEGSVDKRKKIYKEIDKIGKIIEFKPLTFKQCESWIVERVEKTGKRISPRSAAHLLEKVGEPDLFTLDSEINKLIAYIGDEEEIGIADVDIIVTAKAENDIFALTDAVGMGKTAEALKLFHGMVGQGEPVLKILFMISRQFRLIYQCKSLQKQGYTSKQIASMIGQHPFVVSKSLKQAVTYSFVQLSNIMELLLQADISLKSAGLGPQLVLEKLIIELGELLNESKKTPQ